MKKFLQIFSVLLLSCLSVVAIGMAKPQLARAEVPTEWASRTGVQCRWETTSRLRCSDDFGSNIYAEYSLDVVSSATSGHLVFQVEAKPEDRAAIIKQYGVLHFDNNTTYNDLTITTSKTDGSGGVNINDVTKDDIPRDLKVEDADRPNVCSLSYLELGCINGFTLDFDAKNKSNATVLQLAKVETILKEGIASQAPDECQVAVGALGFFLCPLQEIMQKVLVWILNLFVEFLTTPALNSGSGGINRAITGITAIANGFYSIIFLIIIFANFIAIPGLDNYTVKKLLPKLITVIILTQFSFLICSVIIDIGNIAGQTIPSQVLSLYKGAPTDVVAAIAEMLNPYKAIVDELSKVGFSAASAGTIVAIYILAIFQIIAMVIIALISIFYLMFRWFAILLLTIFAPIAFAAWVLPNTEKFTKTWITAFMKLTLMYVLVMTVLASAVIAQDVLKSIDGPVAIIMSLFIPLIALALVPKCLKVSGSMLTAAGKMAADTKAGKAASGAAKGAVKKSGQEGKLAELKGKGFGALSKVTPGKVGMGFATKQAATEGRVSDAKSKLYDSMSTEKLSALSKKGDGKATKTLQGKYQKKRIEAKQASDAGIIYAPESDEEKSYNELATAAGGDNYATSVSKFRTSNGGGTATQQPAAGGGTTNKDPQGLGDLVNMDKNGRGHTSKEVNAWGKKTGGQFISKDNMDVIAANASDIRENLPPQKPLGPPPPPPGGSSTP